MQFTQIPPDYSSLGGGARYAFEADEAADRDFRIAEAGTDRLLGIKRFRNTAAAVFDIAPYLRDRFRFEPGGGPTGFANADGRCVAATVATDGATAAEARQRPVHRHCAPRSLTHGCSDTTNATRSRS